MLFYLPSYILCYIIIFCATLSQKTKEGNKYQTRLVYLFFISFGSMKKKIRLWCFEVVFAYFLFSICGIFKTLVLLWQFYLLFLDQRFSNSKFWLCTVSKQKIKSRFSCFYEHYLIQKKKKALALIVYFVDLSFDFHGMYHIRSDYVGINNNKTKQKKCFFSWWIEIQIKMLTIEQKQKQKKRD